MLKGNLLFYYEKRDDKEPIGVIVLEGCTVELSEMNDTNTFTFELVFQGTFVIHGYSISPIFKIVYTRFHYLIQCNPKPGT